MATDASEYGFGVCLKECKKDVCEIVGRTSERAAGERMLVPIDGFPEVPLEVVEASGWMDVASGRWRYRNENIVLGSRALTRVVEILASTQQLYQKRCVALVDNMAVALSFERRRSRNFLVRSQYVGYAAKPMSPTGPVVFTIPQTSV